VGYRRLPCNKINQCRRTDGGGECNPRRFLILPSFLLSPFFLSPEVSKDRWGEAERGIKIYKSLLTKGREQRRKRERKSEQIYGEGGQFGPSS